MFLIPVFIFLLTAFILVIVGSVRPDFGYSWLIAAGGGFLAWVGGLLIQFLVPLPGDWLIWPTQILLDPALIFAWDRLSWAFMLAIGSLGLAVILADVENAPGREWPGWASSLFLTGLGVLASFAGNFYTTLVLLSALDLMLIFILWRHPSGDPDRGQQIAGYLALRILSTGLLVVSIIGPLAVPAAASGSLVTVVFLMGVMLRLVTVFPDVGDVNSNLAAGYDLIPAAAVLILIPRWFAGFSLQADQILPVAGVTVIGGSVLALAWAVSATEKQGRSAWLGASGGLVLLAGIGGELQASASWGVALLLAGGVLSLYRPAQKWLVVAPALALAGISGLPFTPTWEGIGLYTIPKSSIFMAGLLVQGLLLAGFSRHMLTGPQTTTSKERWVWLIYTSCLVIPLLVQEWIAWYPEQAPADLPRFLWWPPVLAVLIGGIFVWWLQQGGAAEMVRGPMYTVAGLIKVVARPLAGIQGLIDRLTSFLTTILEGEGGVLWALLFLTLLASILLQIDWLGLANGN